MLIHVHRLATPIGESQTGDAVDGGPSTHTIAGEYDLSLRDMFLDQKLLGHCNTRSREVF